MEEGDQRVVQPWTGCFIDQLHPARLDLRQSSHDVIHPIGDVMHARTTFVQIFRKRRFVRGWSDQFKQHITHACCGDLHVALWHRDAFPLADAERLAVEGDSAVNVAYSKTDVIHLLEHTSLPQSQVMRTAQV
jgi:hypothetical protein